jgi:photosystem II stability/assembly factor-like uncharacterized protein
MKRFSAAVRMRAAYACALAAALVSGAACQSEIKDEDPSKAHLTKRDRLFDVAMVGKQAWIVGFPGIILHSADGGKTFDAQAGGGEEALFALDFVSDTQGFIVGREGLVLGTSDGGHTWTRLETGVKDHLFAVDFVDAERGWAVGNFGVIIHTEDAGKTWVRQTVGSPDAAGTAAADEGAAADGGAAAEPAPAFDRLLNGVAFVSRTQGWIVGESGVVLHTVDAGKTWTEQASNEWAPLYSPVFLDEKRGYVSGSEGALLATADGGETWERIDTGITEHLFGLWVSGDSLLAVGRRGAVVRGALTEGAPTFEKVPLGAFTWIVALAMGDEGLGLMVGGQGLILRSADRGKTWEPAELSATRLQAL